MTFCWSFGGEQVKWYAHVAFVISRPELKYVFALQTAAASQVVMHLFVERIEPLYALSGIRTSLESYLRRRAGPGRLDEGTAFAYGMALKAVGTLFGHLPSEVLEEELEQVRGLIKEVRCHCAH